MIYQSIWGYLTYRQTRWRAVAQDVSKGIMGGDRDVYYPSWFLGEWEVRCQLQVRRRNLYYYWR